MHNSDKKKIAGYYIAENVQLLLSTRRLVNLQPGAKVDSLHSIQLRKTMLRLLDFLLENANDKVIANEEILYNVWDIHGLRSSQQRLWQVMQGLKYNLLKIGLPDDLIMRVERRGYFVKSNLVKPFYLDE
ncbi:winged helix-turn-helix domain-containing protein [Serratia sarumanii]|uniref:winged helix-turn-helix domain-containing protein n=1 Tax=Serratia sarumanii TaxID=3020826 RepID=UPI003F7EF7DA